MSTKQLESRIAELEREIAISKMSRKERKVAKTADTVAMITDHKAMIAHFGRMADQLPGWFNKVAIPVLDTYHTDMSGAIRVASIDEYQAAIGRFHEFARMVVVVDQSYAPKTTITKDGATKTTAVRQGEILGWLGFASHKYFPLPFDMGIGLWECAHSDPAIGAIIVAKIGNVAIFIRDTRVQHAKIEQPANEDIDAIIAKQVEQYSAPNPVADTFNALLADESKVALLREFMAKLAAL